jgi:hypothetical protein
VQGTVGHGAPEAAVCPMVAGPRYPHYVAKAERKGRTSAEVDEIFRWLTGYSQEELDAQLRRETGFETFFSEAPRLNDDRAVADRGPSSP